MGKDFAPDKGSSDVGGSMESLASPRNLSGRSKPSIARDIGTSPRGVSVSPQVRVLDGQPELLTIGRSPSGCCHDLAVVAREGEEARLPIAVGHGNAHKAQQHEEEAKDRDDPRGAPSAHGV